MKHRTIQKRNMKKKNPQILVMCDPSHAYVDKDILFKSKTASITQAMQMCFPMGIRSSHHRLRVTAIYTTELVEDESTHVGKALHGETGRAQWATKEVMGMAVRQAEKRLQEPTTAHP